jgi:hypothetical protein
LIGIQLFFFNASVPEKRGKGKFISSNAESREIICIDEMMIDKKNKIFVLRLVSPSEEFI